jgi:hypothetical protein
MLDDDAVAMMNERRTYLVPTTYPVDRINLAVLPGRPSGRRHRDPARQLGDARRTGGEGCRGR